MLKKIVFLLFLSFFLYTCKKKNPQEKVEVKKPEMSIVTQYKQYNELDKFSFEKTANWKEYTVLKEFLNRFQKTSPNEALSNASELKELVKNLKDSIRIEELKTSAFKTRINVLENEALRLADMNTISAISAKEVHNQINKILTVYGSLNDKINTVYKKKRIDVDDFFNLDTKKKKP